MDDASLSPNRDWIPPVIAEFLRAGTRNDDKAYKADLLPRAWALINVLLEKSEAQQEPGEGDALNQAVNSSKGKAIEALFEYALRRCRLADASTGGHVEPWSEMRATFDKELAACRNRNFEFSALAGAYLANFQYLAMSWCHENIKRIFPLDFPANCLSALDGLAYAPATETIYREIADTGILRWALQYGMKEYARERLVQRMSLAYIWGTEDLQSPNFAFLFDNKMTDDLEIACRYLWSIRGQPILDDQKNRILAFWSTCISWARQVKPVPDKLLSALSLLTSYLKSIGQRELECLLAIAPHVSIDYNADLLIQELERLGPASPLEVAEVLLTLLQTYRPAYDFEDRLKTLVTQLGARSETRRYALQCADRLRNIPGMIQLYAQISEQPVG
jgi:hypothetical protein